MEQEGREKQHQEGSSEDKQQQVVIVWDLDETLVLFQSLCNGSYAAEVNRSLQHGGSCRPTAPPVDPAAAHAVGSTLTTCLFDLLDRHLSYEKVEFLDPMHLQEACLGPPYAWQQQQQQSAQRGVQQQQQQQDSQQGILPKQQLQQLQQQHLQQGMQPSQPQEQQRAQAQCVIEGGAHSSQQQQQSAQQQSVQHADEQSKCHHQQGEGPGLCDTECHDSSNGGQVMLAGQGHQAQLAHTAGPQQHAQAFLHEQRLQQSHHHQQQQPQQQQQQQPEQHQESQQQPQQQQQQLHQCLPGQQPHQEHGKEKEEEQQALKRQRSGPYTAVAEIFQHAYQLYSAGFDDLPLTDAERKRIVQVRQDLDVVTHSWRTQALALLHDLSKEASSQGLLLHHCIVTTGQLVATLGKLLLFGLGSTIHADMVYSASKLPKLMVFAAIRERFGPYAAYVAVGDGNEERCAAEAMGWPFVQISLAGSMAVYEQPVCPDKDAAAPGTNAANMPAPLQGGTCTDSDSKECSPLDDSVVSNAQQQQQQQQQQHLHHHRHHTCSPEAVQVKRNGMRVGEVSASVLLELALQTLNCRSNA